MYHIKSDKRSQASAVQIVRGLQECLKNTPLKAVTVSDIHRITGISRATFYRLFDTPEDVLVYQLDQMTENGFIGTVTELVDTDFLEIGMELNVVYASDTRNEIVMESASEYKSQIADQTADHTGTYVIVQFVDYDRETNTLTINLIEQKG